MKGNGGNKKRALGVLLTFIMVFTMIPQTAVSAFADSNADGRIKAADISLNWHTEDRETKNGEKSVSLGAVFESTDDRVTSAEVKISLGREEAQFLKQFRNEDGNLDESMISEAVRGEPVRLETKKDGGVFIVLKLDRENRELEAELDFSPVYDEPAEPGEYNISIDEDDISIVLKDKSGTELENIYAELSLKAEDFDVVVKDKENTDDESENISDMEKNGVKAFEDNAFAEVKVKEYHPAYSSAVFWIDNNDENSIRPSSSEYKTAPKLSFSVDGENYKILEESDLASLGMKSMPDISVHADGTGRYSVSIGENVLPSKITHVDEYGDERGTYDIEWKVTPQDVDGYSLVDVNDENKDEYETVTENGWYYVLNRTVEFTVEYRIGSEEFDYGRFHSAFEKNFKLNINLGNAGERDFLLSEIKDDTDIRQSTEDGSYEYCGIINNAWKYNLDGTRIVYKIEYMGETSAEQHVDVEGLENGDYLSVLYDNTAVPNYGTNTDALYSGGRLYLTLSGTKDYNAEKIWLDEGSDDVKDSRPSGEFQLWRYRAGNSYTTAAPVRDAAGNIVSVKLNTTKDEQKISSKDFEGFTDGMLPKYDSEGHEYIYVLQEYLDGENSSGKPAQSYEQVFGGVNGYEDVVEGKEGEEVKRDTGNNYLYDGGVLLNRIKGTVTISAEKSWKAAAFQAAFEDVKIELTLQSRIKDSDADWENTDIKRTMEDFSAEISTDDISASVAEYDDHGRKLEYRWIETAVYQGKDSGENLLKQENPESGKAEFILAQDGRRVEYESEVKIGKDGSTHITNSIANEVKYEVEKIWYDKDGSIIEAPDGAEVTFNIYRVINGEAISADKSVAEFTMDGNIDDEEMTVNEELGISVRETEPWTAVVQPLTEFDEEGRQYEYVLLETDGESNYIPEYEITKDDEGNYYAEVINRPEGENRIMVRKNWNDNSDIAHRDPVTVTAYVKKTNEKINSITLGETKDGVRNDVWYDWLGIGKYKPEEVYILETKVGETDVPLQEYILDSGENADYDNPEEPVFDDGETDNYTVIQYQTENHKYEASYSIDKVEGVDFYTVENRRLGNIDMTVTKTWTDGDGEKREALQKEVERLNKEENVQLSLAVKLVFHETSTDRSYEIHRQGLDKPDSVTIGRKDARVPILDKEGNHESSIQSIDLSSEKNEQTFYFFNLPKYDEHSTIVRYDVQELWVDENGERVNIDNYKKLSTLWEDYRTSFEETAYKTYEDHGRPDEQSVAVSNYLSGTKMLKWNKSWHDEYNYSNGMRPDIYLDIYKKEHVKDEEGNVVTKTDVYISDYKWTYTDSGDPSSDVNKQHYWQAEIYGAPEYDDLGYEITYYAMEKTAVDKNSFDYIRTMYSGPDSDGGASDYIGNEYEIENTQQADEYMEDVSDFEDGGESGAPHYALAENGIFHNTIERNITVTGQKLWSALPQGYPVLELPTATFTLYRQAHDDTDEPDEEDAFATITIKGEDWASLYQSGSYSFGFKYKGENKYTIENDGSVTVISDDENAELLQKYDENGSMYRYTVKETSMKAGEGAGDSASENMMGDVFSVEQSDSSKPVENVYDSKKGELSVKKILYLPVTENEDEEMVPESYPAVTFELSRTYTGSDGKLSAPETVEEKTWSSSEVKDAWNDKKSIMSRVKALFTGNDKSKDDNIVENTITFENLPIYAPNGSRYVYTVTEKTDYLKGYDVWTMTGDVNAEEADAVMTEPNEGKVTDGYTVGENGAVYEYENGKQIAASKGSPAATFIDRRNPGQEKVTVEGKKIWQDYDDVFEIRPDGIDIELYRKADSQPGQENALSSSKVPEGEYNVDWSGKDSGTWSYEISGADSSGELEKYAPNGMPWKYSVREVQSEDSVYTMNPAKGTTGSKSADSDNKVTLENLTNTIMTSEPYRKTWVDEEGSKLTEDYLGMDITAGFKLQVCEKDSEDGVWYDADEYFEKALVEGSEAYESIVGDRIFTDEIKGRINSPVWNDQPSFGSLPKFIVKPGAEENTELDYRVVETYIKYGEHVQTVTVKDEGDSNTYRYEFSGGMFSPAYPDGGNNYSCSSTNIYNMLKTTDFSVTKNWSGDSSNVYGTRGDTGRSGYDWEVSMLIQRSSDGGGTWEDVSIYDGDVSRNLTVTIYGRNEDDSGEAQISGLPASNEEGNQYIYRARELDTNIGGGGVISGEDGKDKYNASYDVTYDSSGTVVTNTLESTEVYAEKIWNRGVSPKAIAFELKYQKEDGSWASFETPAKVTLDGIADIAEAPGSAPEAGVGEIISAGKLKPYLEYDEWKAVWKDLPKVIPGSRTEGGETVYTVEETIEGDYIKDVKRTSTVFEGSQYLKIEIANNEKTSLSVEKNWYGVDITDQADVTVGLWRTAGEPGDDNSEQVKNDSGQQMTAALSADTGWKTSFKDLPKYDKEGNQYFYYAREIKIGDAPAESREDIIICSNDSRDESGGSFKTVISNIGRIDITGTKTWKDNGNAYGTRPETIELTLYRSATDEDTGVKGKETEVTEEIMKEEGSYLEWSDTGSDVWTYTYKDLPACDVSGDIYSYRVEENHSSQAVAPGGDTSGYEVGEGDRYDYSQSGMDMVNTLADTIEIPVEKIWRDNDNSSDGRPDSVTFLLYGNDNVVERYILTEKDAVQGDANRWSHTFTNLPEYDKDGVRIEYRVEEENAPDGYDVHIYDFTVENVMHGGLSVSKKVEGNAGDKDKEFSFTVELDDKTVNGIYGDMEFVDGRAEFFLKDGETVSADGLSADIGYTVYEKEANSEGYRTFSEDASGKIPAGDTVNVKFTNSKNIVPVDETDPGSRDAARTGDTMNFAVPVILMTLSLAGITAVFIMRRHRKQ